MTRVRGSPQNPGLAQRLAGRPTPVVIRLLRHSGSYVDPPARALAQGAEVKLGSRCDIEVDVNRRMQLQQARRKRGGDRTTQGSSKELRFGLTHHAEAHPLGAHHGAKSDGCSVGRHLGFAVGLGEVGLGSGLGH